MIGILYITLGFIVMFCFAVNNGWRGFLTVIIAFIVVNWVDSCLKGGNKWQK